MRFALLDKVAQTRGPNSATANLPAPTGGWNTRDPLAEMASLDAPLLNNWYPRFGQCALRGGCLTFASGMTGNVKTLMQYQPAGGVPKFFAATDAGIYDITAGGTIGAPVHVLTNGYFNSVNFTNSVGDKFLWGCNGVDPVTAWNGTTWLAPAITGIADPSKLVYPTVFKHHIFCVEKDTMNVWWLPLDSIQGTAAVLPYGSLFRRGGYVMAITYWTLDSGLGPDDLLVAISSEGEIAVYSGTNPADATAWSLVGVWTVGKPVGRRCFENFGADVVLLTENGVFPLSKLLKAGNINFQAALTNKIQPSFTDSVATIGKIEGWDATVFPHFDAMVINIPAGGQITETRQYVMNTITGAWCSFSGWQAYAFEVWNSHLYYGSKNGTVHWAWEGVSDNGADIVATSHQAYNYAGSKTQLKMVNLFRLLLSYSGPIELKWGVSPDYTEVPLNSISLRGSSVGGAEWDTFLWDTTLWAGTSERFKNWRAAAHVPGYALALWWQLATKDANVTWSGTDYILAEGGPM
jgi:hypothetical protein